LAASAAVVFVLSLGELGASLLTVPPGVSTLPLRMFNLLHYGASAEVASLALVTIGIIVVLLSMPRRFVRT
jgi:iron(III) transport system permease protein